MDYEDTTDTNTSGNDSTYRRETVRDSSKPLWNVAFLVALAIGAIAALRIVDGGNRAEIEALKAQNLSIQTQVTELNNRVFELSQQKPYAKVSVEVGTQ